MSLISPRRNDSSSIAGAFLEGRSLLEPATLQVIEVLEEDAQAWALQAPPQVNALDVQAPVQTSLPYPDSEADMELFHFSTLCKRPVHVRAKDADMPSMCKLMSITNSLSLCYGNACIGLATGATCSPDAVVNGVACSFAGMS